MYPRHTITLGVGGGVPVSKRAAPCVTTSAATATVTERFTSSVFGPTHTYFSENAPFFRSSPLPCFRGGAPSTFLHLTTFHASARSST